MNLWLDQADRFKNGAIPLDKVRTIMRDAFQYNGLPSPRESDVRMSLDHAFGDSQGIQLDRGKLGTATKTLVRRELCLKAGVSHPPLERGG